MYRRQRVDTTSNVPEQRVGWKTDKVTKPLIESGFGAALQDGTHGLRHPRTARQLNTYVVDEKGRHGAQEGEHDDLLMAAMIAVRVMDVLLPPRDGKRGQRIPREVTDELTGY
jgi:phage terminase large subunit